MKKAIIVGGSNGVGFAIGRNLIDRGYYLEICDRCAPEKGILPCDLFHYNYPELFTWVGPA